MKVAVLCERSGIVRDAFLKLGHNTISCDLEESRTPGPHRKGSIFDWTWKEFDLIIAFPPCTYLSTSGNAWFAPKHRDRYPDRLAQREEALRFFMKIVRMRNSMIAIENPSGIISTRYRKPDQIIHPYYFGDPMQKRTCLWLKNLPKLVHYKNPELFHEKTHVDKGKINVTPSGKKKPAWMDKGTRKMRQELRSRTFPGIAAAMAEQWGGIVN
jgi:site-specific DNA-cytosine methylase